MAIERNVSTRPWLGRRVSTRSWNPFRSATPQDCLNSLSEDEFCLNSPSVRNSQYLRNVRCPWLEPLENLQLDYLLHLDLDNPADFPKRPSWESDAHDGGTTVRDPNYEVDWETADKGNPKNWPTWYRGCILGIVSFSTMIV